MRLYTHTHIYTYPYVLPPPHAHHHHIHRVGKVLRFLGLSVGAMTGTSIGGPLERLTDKEEFMKDVTYTTALALGFSFLNDQLAGHGKALVCVGCVVCVWCVCVGWCMC